MALLDLVVTLIVVFAILVAFHELGHFLFAKLFKMRVEEFALGMGNPKFRVYYDGETEYTLRAFPIGGFVRIGGMEIEDEAERKLTEFGRKKQKNSPDTFEQQTPGMIDQDFGGIQTTNLDLFKEEEQEEIAEEDGIVPDPNGFNTRPIWQRYLVILAGPVFSLLLGWLSYSLIGITVGIPTGPPTTRIMAVNPGSPAEKAGLHIGDRVLAIDGAPVADGNAMVKTIHASPNRPLNLTVLRAHAGDTQEIVSVTPNPGEVDGKKVGLIGIRPDSVLRRVSVGESFTIGTFATVGYFKQLFSIFQHNQVRENLGGPVRIVAVTKQAVDMGGSSKMELLASLSLSLAFFNLLPIPILDGGHLMLFTLEAIRRRKLTAEQTQRVLMAGLAILAVMVVFIWFNDIAQQPWFHRG